MTEIETMIQQRVSARARKDWAEFERLSEALADDGVILTDGLDGVTTFTLATDAEKAARAAFKKTEAAMNVLGRAVIDGLAAGELAGLRSVRLCRGVIEKALAEAGLVVQHAAAPEA